MFFGFSTLRDSIAAEKTGHRGFPEVRMAHEGRRLLRRKKSPRDAASRFARAPLRNRLRFPWTRPCKLHVKHLTSATHLS